MRLTLLTKGLIIVCIPLVFEIGIFATLLSMQSEIEEESHRINEARKLNYQINQFIAGMADVAGVSRDSTFKGLNLKHYAEVQSNMRNSLAELKKLCADDPRALKKVKSAEYYMDRIDTDVREAAQELAHTLPFDFQFVARKYSKRLNDDLLMASRNTGIMALADETANVANRDASEEKRKVVLLLLKCALGASVIIAVAIATWISRELTSRLMIVRDNARRLAANQPLLEPLTGKDEISELDRSFHLAVEKLEIAFRKEQAILTNAGDLICAFDDKLKIQSINPAGAALLNASSEEIVGVSILKFIKESEKEAVDKSLKDAKERSAKVEIETVLQPQAGCEITAIFSVSYSSSDKTFYCVAHDVTAQKQLENIKREVTAMITHDLKTPLQTMRNYLEMLNVGKFGELNESGRKFLALADRESERMVNLIESVLQLEQLRSGNVELNSEQLALLAIVEKSVEAVQLLADNKSISITTKLIEAEVSGEAKWIEQILVNILANAINYSPAQSSIVVSMINEASFTEVHIKDQGPGLTDQEKTLIFERFQRLSKQAQKVAGTGLGLTICKELVDLHGGYIKVESTLAVGSTFILGFPHNQVSV